MMTPIGEIFIEMNTSVGYIVNYYSKVFIFFP